TAETKYACIFTIMSQIAIEPEELHQIQITQINKNNGELSVTGTKQHSNANQPFPKAKTMCETWRNTKIRASIKLCKPDLRNIPLKNLRNYAGAQFYKTTGKHDPIATMRFMRHKK